MNKITEAKIMKYLDRCEIKHSYSGFIYITDIIMAMAEGKLDRTCIAKAYRMVAEKYQTSKEGVEKSIRFAIKNSKRKNVTNKEFLCTAFDTIVFEEEEI